jgi:curved DNA-binding protein
MQNFRNYYAILNIAREATEEEIKKSFRRLARQYHPDLNPGNKAAEEQFKTIGEAYEILSDPDRRAKYDQFSRFWKQKGFQTQAPRQSSKSWGKTSPTTSPTATDSAVPEVDYSQFPDFNIFVEQLLGREVDSTPDFREAPARPVPEPEPVYGPRKVYRTVKPGSEVPRNTSPRNTSSRNTSPRNAVGSGSRPNLKEYRPGTTKKAYTVVPRVTRKDVEARLQVPLERAYLGGRERVRLEDGRSLEVEMPGGMVTGQQIRLRGQGIGGGDLYLRVQVPTHDFFRLEGSDIHCQIALSPPEAVLGHRVEVPTLDGPVQMWIPPGVRSGQRLRLAEKGYPTPDGGRGDQIVEVQIVTPTHLSPEEQGLYEQLYELDQRKSRPVLPID